jgi:mannose-6-phosphate isomerase-like protein (cupin superfamily)
MDEFIRKLKDKPSYSQKGLDGYRFPLSNKEIQIYFVDVKKGHDTYIVSKKITHIYYILEGGGSFDIGGKKIQVKPGMMVEVPPNVEYTYSGKMKILLIMIPPWFAGNDEITRKNPSVE